MLAVVSLVLLSLQIVKFGAFAARPASPTTHLEPVLIVGAGVAGAKVAEELHAHGIPFIIFEASDRVGGRLQLQRIGSDGPFLETGANWMQGFREGVPFFDFVTSRIGLEGPSTDFDDMYFYNNGTVVDDDVADPVWETAEQALAKIYDLQKALINGSDSSIGHMNVQSAVEYAAGFSPRDPIEVAAWQVYIDFEYATPGNQVSIRDLSPIYAPDAPESSDIFVNDHRGFRAVVDVTLQMAGIPNSTESSEKLRLNSPVRTIRYSKKGAEVVLQDGAKYMGSAVVSTVSLGVLKDSLLTNPPNDNRLKFDPPLSAKKRVAISKMMMADYLKVFVQFTTPVLSKEDPLFLLPISCRKGGFINVMNLNKPGYFPTSNIVMVTSTGAYSRELNCRRDEEVLEDILEYVSIAVGRKVQLSEIKAYIIPNFRQNEFIRGSYSVNTPSMSEQDSAELNKPSGALFFAGEAHRSEALNGYVHGAWDTGKATAEDVMAFLEGKP